MSDRPCVAALGLLFFVVGACRSDPAPSRAPSAQTGSSAPPAVTAADAGARRGDVIATSKGDARVIPLHHATFVLELDGHAVYFDPVKKDVSYDGLPKAAAVFVTDIHRDHMDPDGIASVSDASTVVIAPPAVAEKLPSSIAHVHPMKNGDVGAADAPPVPRIPSLGVEAVPMYNKQRGPAPGKLYHDKGRGNGYVLSFGGKRFYVSGDTECTDEMKALKDIDVAFVCMNLPYTMPPSEAGACVAAFRPKVVYPYHYRGSDLAELERAVGGASEVRRREWY